MFQEILSTVSKCILFYDTIFNLGDFNLSVLSCSSKLFASNPVYFYGVYNYPHKKEVHADFLYFNNKFREK